MDSKRGAGFLIRLVAPMLDQLRRIVSAAAKGEVSLEELQAEAWIAAEEHRLERGLDLEPDDQELQGAVLLKLWRAFGKFANRTMRTAFRLDQETIGNDGEGAINAVAASLAAAEIYEPETAIELAQERAQEERRLADRFTEAVATRPGIPGPAKTRANDGERKSRTKAV